MCLLQYNYIDQDSKYFLLKTGWLKQLRETAHLVVDSRENSNIWRKLFNLNNDALLATLFKHGLPNLQARISNLHSPSTSVPVGTLKYRPCFCSDLEKFVTKSTVNFHCAHLHDVLLNAVLHFAYPYRTRNQRSPLYCVSVACSVAFSSSVNKL